MVSLEREQQPDVTTKEATQTVVVRASSMHPDRRTDGEMKGQTVVAKHSERTETLKATLVVNSQVIQLLL